MSSDRVIHSRLTRVFGLPQRDGLDASPISGDRRPFPDVGGPFVPDHPDLARDPVDRDHLDPDRSLLAPVSRDLALTARLDVDRLEYVLRACTNHLMY